MSKILLVEDDNNLREIYEARLQAEGYDIVSAQDGEDALVKAKQEKPDLIISDVMMPRISGFEMLDILRNTEGLKHTKVIMLTALGQAEDQTRADSLGADRYLVKSQVTLEDIVKAAQELLTQAATPIGAAGAATAAVLPATPQATTTTGSAPVINTPVPVSTESSRPTPAPAGAPVKPPEELAATPTPAVPAAPAIPTPIIPVAQPPAAAPTTQPPVNPALPPTPLVPAPATNTTVAQTKPEPVVPAPTIAAPAPRDTPTPAPITPVAPTPVATGQSNSTSTPVPAPPSAPAATTSPTPAPTTPPQTPAVPAVPAKPAEAPATSETTKTEETAEAPKTTSPTQVDDKLIADAMKNLTASLSGEPETAKTPEEPEDSNAAAPEAKTEAPTPPKLEAPDAPVEPPKATEAETPPASAPESPTVTPPVETTSPETPDKTDSVEPDLDLASNVLPGVTGVDSPSKSEAPAITPTEPPKTTPVPITPPAEQPPANNTTETAALPTTASTADEQAVMKQQIDDFIKQQDARQTTEKPEVANQPLDTAMRPTPQPAEAPDLTAPIAPAAPTPEEALPSTQESLVTPTKPLDTPVLPTLAPEAAPSGPTTFKPDAPSSTTQITPAEASEPESVSIAHKKVIQPPVEPMTNQPNLSELLAREGIQNFDDNPTPSGPVTSNSSFTQPPHQPGHVISPGATQSAPAQPPATNVINPDDPNNIAL